MMMMMIIIIIRNDGLLHRWVRAWAIVDDNNEWIKVRNGCVADPTLSPHRSVVSPRTTYCDVHADRGGRTSPDGTETMMVHRETDSTPLVQFPLPYPARL